MPSYRFQVRSQDGQVRTGTMQADTAGAAAAILRNQGVHVVSVDSLKAGGGEGGILDSIKKLNSGKPNQKHVLDFTTQLAVMIRAGINLRSALDGIADQTTHAGFKKVILEIKQDVESGQQFSQALTKHPKLFGELYINMMRASEMTGGFSQMLERIAGYIRQQIETRKMVVGASIYPAIIGILAVSVTIFLLTFVLPKFYTIFEGKEDVLPWATTFLMTLSKGMVAYWPFILGGVVAFVGGIFAITRTELGSFWVDKLKLTDDHGGCLGKQALRGPVAEGPRLGEAR